MRTHADLSLKVILGQPLSFPLASEIGAADTQPANGGEINGALAAVAGLAIDCVGHPTHSILCDSFIYEPGSGVNPYPQDQQQSSL